MPALIGLVFALAAYVVLPALGINIFTEALGIKQLTGLVVAPIFGVFYWQYLKWILPRPQILLAFIVLAWPMVAFLNAGLLDLGLNIHLRPLLILALAVPSLWLTLKQGSSLWSVIPWFKYYLVFFVWLLLYFVFFNANAVDPRLSGGEEAMSEGSVSMVQLTAYFYCLMTISVTAITFLGTRNYRKLFDALNYGLIWISGLEALMTIIGFPFGLLSFMLDGFMRAIGIFSHPNTFAHHMGILLVYLVGLHCYYQGDRKGRMPHWLLFAGLAVNFMAFLLGLSKTAFAVTALCILVIFLMNLAVPAIRKSLFRILLGLAIVLPLGLLAYQVLSGQSFLSLLESRIDQTQSLTWRTSIWQDLLSEINGMTLWFGHGFTAANETVYRLTYNDSQNAKPLMMVHNAYIALLYDCGVMGYTLILAALSLGFHSFRFWLAASVAALRVEHSIILALTLYFLLVCALDEMSYMFDAPMLFWAIGTMLYCLNLRERHDTGLSNPSLYKGFCP